MYLLRSLKHAEKNEQLCPNDIKISSCQDIILPRLLFTWCNIAMIGSKSLGLQMWAEIFFICRNSWFVGGSFNWMLHILKCINYFFSFWQKCFSLIFDVLTLLLFLINWPIKIEQKVKEKMVEAKVWFANAYFIFSIKKLQQQHEPASSLYQALPLPTILVLMSMGVMNWNSCFFYAGILVCRWYRS